MMIRHWKKGLGILLTGAVLMGACAKDENGLTGPIQVLCNQPSPQLWGEWEITNYYVYNLFNSSPTPPCVIFPEERDHPYKGWILTLKQGRYTFESPSQKQGSKGNYRWCPRDKEITFIPKGIPPGRHVPPSGIVVRQDETLELHFSPQSPSFFAEYFVLRRVNKKP